MDDIANDLPPGLSKNVLKIRTRFRQRFHLGDRTTTFSTSGATMESEDKDYRWDEVRPATSTVTSRLQASPNTSFRVAATVIQARSPAPASTPRRQAPARATTESVAVRTGIPKGLRFFAIKEAHSYAWQFVQTSHRVFDVDTRHFPYELVRRQRLKDYERRHEQHTTPLSGQRHQFMHCFDDKFARAAVERFQGATCEQPMAVKACFGRLFFRLVTLQPQRSYRWSELRDARRNADAKSSWSNVCIHEDCASLDALIEALRQKQSEAETQSSPLKLVVHCTSPREEGQFKLVYLHQAGRWTFKEAYKKPTTYAYHDISLADGVDFRIKVYSRAPVVDGAWWTPAQRAIRFSQRDRDDPFSTRVSLSPDTPKCLKIVFTSITRTEADVDFAGLHFQLDKNRDSTFLRAYPPRYVLAKKDISESLEVLIKQLVQVLAVFAADD